MRSKAIHQRSYTSLWWRHPVNACVVTAQLAPFVSCSLLSGLNLFVAVLCDRLLSVVYIACKVERFVSIIFRVHIDYAISRY